MGGWGKPGARGIYREPHLASPRIRGGNSPLLFQGGVRGGWMITPPNLPSDEGREKITPSRLPRFARAASRGEPSDKGRKKNFSPFSKGEREGVIFS